MHRKELAVLRERLARSTEPITVASIAELIRAQGYALGSETTTDMTTTLRDQLIGLGPLQVFADRPGVSDVLLDGEGQIITDGDGGLEPTGVFMESEEHTLALAKRLIALAGGRLDESQPFADARIGRYRIHAIIPPVAVGSTLISIRIARPSTADLSQLAQQWVGARRWIQAIELIINAKKNYLVSGSTGSGKTALLAAMLSLVSTRERILIVEDTTELTPAHPHALNIQARTANIEGAGAIDLGRLLREALRMRPDRLIMGECRGAEVRELLSAMNTGHQGAGATIHANSPEAVSARLVAMGALAHMNPQNVSLQASAALDVVIHMQRCAGHRMPVALSQVVLHDQYLVMKPLLWVKDGTLNSSSHWHSFVESCS